MYSIDTTPAGRSFVLERQERFSYETNERIYLNEHRLYQNPSVDVAGISSSSDDIEKIHRTRERVESLNSQINFEIERLKDVKNSLQKKDESLMTWAQRFRANPPLINVLNKQQCPGRLDDVSKLGPKKEVKQKDVSPRKPPPNIPMEMLPNGIPPKEHLPKEIPKEIGSNWRPPSRPSPEGLPKELTAKITPPKRPPPKELPHKELTYILLPRKEIPPKDFPHKELNPGKPPPPRAFPAKEIPPKELALKEINPRKPTTGGLPPKAFPLKGIPPKNIPSKGVLAKNIPGKGVLPKTTPLKGLPPKTISSKGVPPKINPPKGVPSKGVPPKVPPKGVTLKTIPPKGVPSKPIPPKGMPQKAVPPKTIAPKGVPQKTFPPKEIPPKSVPPKGVPPKEITLRKPPPKVIPPKDLPAKRLPLKELPGKKTPPKAPMMTRKAPPKISTQKELKPEKQPAKDVAPKEPIPKEQPKQGSLGDAPPEELAGRISAGCCHCYWNCDQCVCPTLGGVCCIAPTDYNCNMGFNQGIQYGVPYCTARRRVTDLNTQEICSNRCVGISPDRKSSKSNSVRESTKDKRKSPVRSRRSSPANRMRNQEKLPKVESQKKVQKVPDLGKRPQGPEKLLKELKEKPRLKKDYQPPGKTNQEKPKAPNTNVTKLDMGAPIASPTNDENISVDAQMYEDYLNSYFQENSKTDLLESPKPTPTYTRLQDETVPKEFPISDRKIGERKEHQASSRCYAEMYAGPFRYDECFEYQDYKTEPVSDPQPTTPKDCQCPQPSQNRKSSKFEDKICQGERSSLARDWDTDSTSYAALPVKRQSETPSTRQASTTTETQRNKERSSLTYPLHSSEKSTQVYNDWQSNLSSGPRLSRKDQSPTTDSPRLSNLSNGASLSRKAQSPTADSPRLSNLSNGASLSRKANSPTTNSPRLSNLSNGASLSRKANSPTADSPRLSNLSNGASSSRKAQSPTTDSPRLSNLSNGAGSSRKAQSPTTDSPRLSILSPISFREGSSQVPQSPTRDSSRQGNASPLSFEANSSRIAASETADSTFNTIVSNPHYQAENSFEHSSDDSSDEGTKYDPRIDMQLLDTDVVSNKNTSFEDAFSTLSGKTVRSSNESPRGSFKKPSSRRQSQEEANGHKNKYYSSQTDDIQPRCECNGYETARSIDSSKQSNFLRGRSSSPDKSGADESLPLVETLCEKRTRTVTFKDEQGDLKRQRNVEKECRSHYNWDQALNYSRQDSTFPNDNYTPRSSSSTEHTCLESSFDEDDAYDSCFESPRRSDEQMPTFKACPCMYETYRQLAALCQTKSPYYR